MVPVGLKLIYHQLYIIAEHKHTHMITKNINFISSANHRHPHLILTSKLCFTCVVISLALFSSFFFRRVNFSHEWVEWFSCFYSLNSCVSSWKRRNFFETMQCLDTQTIMGKTPELDECLLNAKFYFQLFRWSVHGNTLIKRFCFVLIIT